MDIAKYDELCASVRAARKEDAAKLAIQKAANEDWQKANKALTEAQGELDKFVNNAKNEDTKIKEE